MLGHYNIVQYDSKVTHLSLMSWNVSSDFQTYCNFINSYVDIDNQGNLLFNYNMLVTIKSFWCIDPIGLKCILKKSLVRVRDWSIRVR